MAIPDMIETVMESELAGRATSMETNGAVVRSRRAALAGLLLTGGAGLVAQQKTTQQIYDRIQTDPQTKLAQQIEQQKEAHAACKKDAARLRELASGLDEKLQKSEELEADEATLKQVAEMEKLVKRVQARMKRQAESGKKSAK